MNTIPLPAIHPDELKELERIAGHKFESLAEAHAFRRKKLEQDGVDFHIWGRRPRV
jgi:hypothetical protein